MKKILLVCSAGMSTSLLVTKMRNSAKEKGIEVEIDALPVAEASTAVDNVDIVLLGPQVRFQKGTVEKLVKGRIPVEVMDMRLYGMMNGKAILEDALQKIGKEAKKNEFYGQISKCYRKIVSAFIYKVERSKTHMRSKRCFYFIIPINDGRIIDGVIE